MKLVQTTVLIDRGDFSKSAQLAEILDEIHSSIQKVSWPAASGSFTLNPTKKGNGVKPIKNECMLHLEEQGWASETRLQLASSSRPGPIDATKSVGDEGRVFAVEWETGNISSSHRALNKMVVGLLEGKLVGGVLILPSREMYRFLTDRVGNFAEIAPYFPVWESLNLTEGYLAIIEVEHDGLDTNVAMIPKGTDGWALHQRLENSNFEKQ